MVWLTAPGESRWILTNVSLPRRGCIEEYGGEILVDRL